MWDIRNIYRLLPVEPKTFKKNEKIQARIQRRAGSYVKLFRLVSNRLMTPHFPLCLSLIKLIRVFANVAYVFICRSP
jgi:hypothetical protein